MEFQCFITSDVLGFLTIEIPLYWNFWQNGITQSSELLEFPMYCNSQNIGIIRIPMYQNSKISEYLTHNNSNVVEFGCITILIYQHFRCIGFPRILTSDLLTYWNYQISNIRMSTVLNSIILQFLEHLNYEMSNVS